jgi:DNA (cytosine-5)-methyltransferase 1
VSGCGLVVDLFAGGGGASVGIEAALGRAVDLAINHDRVALAVHRLNHPGTRHLEADIWEVKPLEATGGAPVDVLWASPDCTHFSVAKGNVPRSQGIRSLAWVVVDWAREVRPRVIFLENVQEFRGWGPLGDDGRPDKARLGETFRTWRAQLEHLGYQVDHRVLDASLYGAPTRRKRLFLIARRDGLPIRWPEPTHGPGRLPVRTAAECIDWSLPCPSIFERKRPLAEKTLWRIAEGIRRFVLESPAPFIVKMRGEAHSSGIDAPLPTVTAGGDRAGHTLGLCTPVFVEPGQRHGRGNRGGEEPLSTIVAKDRHAIAAAALVEMTHSNAPHGVDEALGVVTTQHNRFALVSPTLIQTGYGERPGQAARVPGLHQPIGTMVNGQKHALVAAFLAKHFGGVVGHELGREVGAVTGRDHHALAAATLLRFNHDDHGVPLDQRMPTTTAEGNHVAEVRAFLTTYYGSGSVGQSPARPLRTITAKHRLGLVTVSGVDYQIVDIGMRMLEPNELLAAQFGRFADAYDLSAATTKSAKVRLIGNSVCPEVAEAIVRENVGVLELVEATA